MLSAQSVAFLIFRIDLLIALIRSRLGSRAASLGFELFSGVLIVGADTAFAHAGSGVREVLLHAGRSRGPFPCLAAEPRAGLDRLSSAPFLSHPLDCFLGTNDVELGGPSRSHYFEIGTGEHGKL